MRLGSLSTASMEEFRVLLHVQMSTGNSPSGSASPSPVRGISPRGDPRDPRQFMIVHLNVNHSCIHEFTLMVYKQIHDTKTSQIYKSTHPQPTGSNPTIKSSRPCFKASIGLCIRCLPQQAPMASSNLGCEKEGNKKMYH